jgi:hypothetical protein
MNDISPLPLLKVLRSFLVQIAIIIRVLIRTLSSVGREYLRRILQAQSVIPISIGGADSDDSRLGADSDSQCLRQTTLIGFDGCASDPLESECITHCMRLSCR